VASNVEIPRSILGTIQAFLRKVGILKPASADSIKMPSLRSLVSSFFALMIHQIVSLV